MKRISLKNRSSKVATHHHVTLTSQNKAMDQRKLKEVNAVESGQVLGVRETLAMESVTGTGVDVLYQSGIAVAMVGTEDLEGSEITAIMDVAAIQV